MRAFIQTSRKHSFNIMPMDLFVKNDFVLTIPLGCQSLKGECHRVGFSSE